MTSQARVASTFLAPKTLPEKGIVMSGLQANSEALMSSHCFW